MLNLIIDNKYNEYTPDDTYAVKNSAVNKNDKFDKLLDEYKGLKGDKEIKDSKTLKGEKKIKDSKSPKGDKEIKDSKTLKGEKKVKDNKSLESDKKIEAGKSKKDIKRLGNEIAELMGHLDKRNFSRIFDKFKNIVNNKKLSDNAKKIKLLNLIKDIKGLLIALQGKNVDISRFIKKNNLNKKTSKKADEQESKEVKLNNRIKVINKKKHLNIKKGGTFNFKKQDDGHNLKLKNNISSKNFFSMGLKSDNLEKFDNLIKTEKSHSLSKAEVNKLIDSIVQKGKITLSEGKSEIMMRLKPDILGDMLLKMDINNKGKLEGKIIVNNMMAEKVLKDNLAQLKVSFQEMGLEVGNFDINLNEGFNFNRGQDRRFDFEYSNVNGYSDIMSEENVIDENFNLVSNYYLTDWLASNINMRI